MQRLVNYTTDIDVQKIDSAKLAGQNKTSFAYGF